MILGIDIGGTKCAALLGDSSGKVHSRKSLLTETGKGPDAILQDIIKLAKELLLEQNIASGDLQGIGISCGGPIDSKEGIVFSPPNLPGWDAVPICSMFKHAFPDTPVVLENDANATALAEWRWGAGKGTQNMLFLTMGTGVGGGLILDGKLYRGTNDLAGELGHQTILVNGPQCPCGKRGCLEALCSGPSIARLARESLQYGRGKKLLEEAGGRAVDITARHVIELAKKGDPFCITLLEEVGTYMGIGLSNLIMILNPERIVLGTIAVHAGDLLMNPIRKAIAEYTWKRSAAVCEVVPAALGDSAQDLAALSIIS